MPRGPKRLRTPNGKLTAIGERLQVVRNEKNMTQEQLAARIGAIANWDPLRESVNMTLRGERIVGDLEVCAIADAVGCNPIWLMFGYGDPWERPQGYDYKPYSDLSVKSGDSDETDPQEGNEGEKRRHRRNRPSSVLKSSPPTTDP